MGIGNEGVRIPTAAAQTQWWLSWVELAKSGRSSVGSALNGGNETVGCMFFFLRAVTVTGIRFYANFPTYPRNVKCGFWNIDQAAELANQTVTVTAEGEYIATFAAPYVVPANRVGDQYAVGMYDTTGGASARYTEVDYVQFNSISNVMNGPSVFLFIAKSYGGPGYLVPGSNGAADYPFPVEPIIT
jgi:hypothetical protein